MPPNHGLWKGRSETMCWPSTTTQTAGKHTYTPFLHISKITSTILQSKRAFQVEENPELTLEPSAKGTRRFPTERPKMFFSDE